MTSASMASSAPADVPTPTLVVFRVGPWTLPMTDQQRHMMDRLIARARSRGLPFVSIQDTTRRECVAWVVEPLPAVAHLLATGDAR